MKDIVTIFRPMGLYDLTFTKKPKQDLSKDPERKENIAKIKYQQQVLKRAKGLMDIIDGELAEGFQYRIITENAFNAIVVIEYLFEFYELEEIYLCVYRMNLKSVDAIRKIITSKNIKCKIILSSFFRENKRYEKWCDELMSFAEHNPHTTIAFAWSHAKVFLAKTKNGKHIVFEGSGNLSDNARIEQYIIEDNHTVYFFHKKWMNEFFT